MKKIIQHKTYTLLYCFIVILILSVACLINNLDLTNNENDVIRKYQSSKMVKNLNIDTIFLGDSSCGNSINANHFNQLSNKSSMNLCLTGSFGMEGNINNLKNSLEAFPNLQNVVLIHSMNMWTQNFSYMGFFDTLKDTSLFEKYSTILKESTFKKFIMYKFNPREISWFVKSFTNRVNHIDTNYDYLAQSTIKYSNNTKKMSSSTTLQSKVPTVKKLDVFNLYSQLCVKEKLNCAYLHGPIHTTVAQNSLEQIQTINSKLTTSNQAIKVSTKVFAYPNKMMGDSSDHIDTNFKDSVTKDYFQTLRLLNFF